MTAPNTTQSPTWQELTAGNHTNVSDSDLMQAYAEVNTAIHGLERMGEVVPYLRQWSKMITQIQSDRQAAKRPKAWTMVYDMEDGRITYATTGGRWTAGPNEQTEQLRKQLEAVYETATMVKR